MDGIENNSLYKEFLNVKNRKHNTVWCWLPRRSDIPSALKKQKKRKERKKQS